MRIRDLFPAPEHQFGRPAPFAWFWPPIWAESAGSAWPRHLPVL